MNTQSTLDLSSVEPSSPINDEPGSDRENLFDGSDHRWLHYLEGERALIQAMNDDQANDLSLHLYNTHAIRRLNEDKSGLASYEHKSQARKKQYTLFPPRAWAAWPLSIKNVPREEGHGHRYALSRRDTVRAPDNWLPGNDMREEMLALVLRQAQRQLQARNALVRQPSKHTEHAEAVGTLHDLGSRNSETTSRKSIDESAEEETGGVEAETDKANSTTGKHNHISSKQQPLHRILQLIDDDDCARKLFGSSIRHMLSRFDHLLSALHESRVGQNLHSERPRPSSPHERNVSSSDYENHHNLQEQPTYTSQHQMRDPLHARDWSEVLGIASLIGWDQDVLNTTLQRCSSLFGETMSFGVHGSLNTEPIHQTTPQTTHEPELRSKGLAYFACPYIKCARSMDTIQGYHRLEEHLRCVHKWNQAGLDEYKTKGVSTPKRNNGNGLKTQRQGFKRSYSDIFKQELQQIRKL